MTESTVSEEQTPPAESASPITEPDAAPADTSQEDGRQAIEALQELSPRAFSRLCRRIPLRTFLPELERIERSVFYRYFKGYRPQKIDAAHVDRVLRKEIFDNSNGLLAQLVIYNWDEAEYQLYGELQKEVKKINEDVEAIQEITDAQGDEIFGALEAAYDKRDVAIAAVINGVRVSKDYKAKRFAGAL